MPDTERNLTALLALYADNTTGDISPQDLRDGIVSILGGYGGLKITSAQAMSGTIGTGYIVANIWNDTLPVDANSTVVPDAANDDIDVAVAADYEVHVCIRCSSGSASEAFTFAVFVNGVETDVKGVWVTDSGGNGPMLSFSGIISVSAADAVDVRVKATGASKSITANNGTFWLKRVS